MQPRPPPNTNVSSQINRKDTNAANNSALILISNHLRQFLSCDPDITTGSVHWKWHLAPQPWSPPFQFQLLTLSSQQQNWTPLSPTTLPLEVQSKLVVAVHQPKVYVGWNEKQELCIYTEIGPNAIWTIKATFQHTFTLVNTSNLLLTTLPQPHLASNPPPPLTQFQFQWIPSIQPPSSPGLLDYPIVLFQNPYVIIKKTEKTSCVSLKKVPNKVLDIECMLVQLFHVKWCEDHWEVEDAVDVFRSNGRHVVLKVYQTKKYLCCNLNETQKGEGILMETDEVEEHGIFEFHKLPHSPLAFGLRSITEHKYLGVNKGRLSWVQPVNKHFFWTFLVPPTFAQAIMDMPHPKMPKRMIVTMTAIITAATIGAVTGITNFFMNF